MLPLGGTVLQRPFAPPFHRLYRSAPGPCPTRRPLCAPFLPRLLLFKALMQSAYGNCSIFMQQNVLNVKICKLGSAWLYYCHCARDVAHRSGLKRRVGTEGDLKLLVHTKNWSSSHVRPQNCTILSYCLTFSTSHVTWRGNDGDTELHMYHIAKI